MAIIINFAIELINLKIKKFLFKTLEWFESYFHLNLKFLKFLKSFWVEKIFQFKNFFYIKILKINIFTNT